MDDIDVHSNATTHTVPGLMADYIVLLTSLDIVEVPTTRLT